MDLDKYIIHQGTPESRLLSRLGFDRHKLEVTKWKGRRRSKGGFGRGPVAWQISGQENIEQMCNEIIRVLEQKSSSKLTNEEQKVLNRATKTLSAINKKRRELRKDLEESAKREPIIQNYLSRIYPIASKEEIDLIMSYVVKSEINSTKELVELANKILSGRPKIWEDSRFIFIKTIRNALDKKHAEHLNS